MSPALVKDLRGEVVIVGLLRPNVILTYVKFPHYNFIAPQNLGEKASPKADTNLFQRNNIAQVMQPWQQQQQRSNIPAFNPYFGKNLY